jgi:cell filamentation protein
MNKKSIRFYNDHEVRAVWDEENSKWWFSATDIVSAINNAGDYKKCRNYWKYLKGKMAKEGIQLVSVTNHFKCRAEYLMQNLEMIEKMPQTTFDEIADKYVEMNMAHPFMEGNGRSTRLWLDLIFKKEIKMCVDWSKIEKKEYLDAMHRSTTNASRIKTFLRGALTDRIDDREIFMKGIDYSYYYEENN